MVSLKLKVSGMSCQHCVKSVTNGLNNAEGISNINVDLDTKTVSVDYDENLVTKDRIIETLDRLGYKAE